MKEEYIYSTYYFVRQLGQPYATYFSDQMTDQWWIDALNCKPTCDATN